MKHAIILATSLATAIAAFSATAADVLKDENANVAANLKRFDQLDFDAYSHRKDMPLFRKLHCDDVKVVYADGRTTLGIEAHVQDVHNIFFNGTPDSRITAHPIRIGQGDWTAVTGVVEATFTEPMKMPGAADVPPTGKKAKVPVVTVALWRNGCIAEEQIFFDNMTYLKQLGLMK